MEGRVVASYCRWAMVPGIVVDSWVGVGCVMVGWEGGATIQRSRRWGGILGCVFETGVGSMGVGVGYIVTSGSAGG